LRSYARGEFVIAQGVERAVGVTSAVGDPNALAGLIMGLLPFLVAAFRSSRGLLARLVLLPVFPLALGALIVTGSRASLLALMVMALYYVLQSKHKVISFACLVTLACLVWVGMPQQYRDRYLTVRTFAEGGELDESNASRIQIWKAGWRMFLDHPILGVGAGQFSTAYGTVYSGVAHGPWMRPHNLLVQVGCELGMIGLVVFAYFLTQIIKAIRSVLQLRGQGPYVLNYEVAVACSAMFLGVIAVSVVGHTLYRPYWYLLGGFAAANRSIVDGLADTEAAAARGRISGATKDSGPQRAH
jgi:O-antigen ligase